LAGEPIARVIGRVAVGVRAVAPAPLGVEPHEIAGAQDHIGRLRTDLALIRPSGIDHAARGTARFAAEHPGRDELNRSQLMVSSPASSIRSSPGDNSEEMDTEHSGNSRSIRSRARAS